MKEIIKQIEKYNIFYIFGHIDPDGDCIGSQLALEMFLKRIGKKAKSFSDGRFGRAEIKPFEKRFEKIFSPFEEENNDAAAIIVDCSTPDRTGKFTEVIPKYETIVIDHHSSGSRFGSFRYIDASAASSTMLILKLIKEMGLSPSKEEAEFLLLGLCTDTAFFKHLTETGSDAFIAAAEFTKAGASPNKIYFDINGNKKLDSIYLTAKILGRTASYFGGKLLITYETLKDYENIPYECRDIDTIYILLLETENAKIIADIKEENETEISVGLRTRSCIDVGKIAKMFGGGGHQKASGFKVEGTIEEIRNKLIEAFTPLLRS